MAKRGHAEAQRLESQPGGHSGRTACLILGFLVLGVLLAGELQNTLSSETRMYSLVFTQMPLEPSRPAKSVSTFSSREDPPTGSRIVLLSNEGTITILTPEFAAAVEPSVSFEGKRILFSGRRTKTESWNIWEMDFDGKNKQQITQNFGDCREPKYLATSSITPPEFSDKVRWITFTSNAANAWDELAPGMATALYARNLEPIEGSGFVTRRSTFNLSSDFSPVVLHDGRILFTSHQKDETSHSLLGRFLLLASNWDGTGINLFCGTNQGATLKTMACEMPDRTLVFVESAGENPDGSGRLARVSFRRPLQSHELLSKAEGRYRNPTALPDGQLLLSYKTAAQPYALFLFDFDRGQPGPKVYGDPQWECVGALAAVASPEPQGLISSVVDSETAADLQCLNVYDSDQPEAASIKKGEIKRVRLVEGVPVPMGPKPQKTPPALRMRSRILGEVPVESDGSFMVRVPGDTPFYLQTLNDEGMALMTMPNWMWVRRGTSRGCIGCHENKELAPENRATDALVHLRSQVLLTPVEQRRSVTFRKDIQPVIQKHCVSCHGGKNPSGGLELSSSSNRQSNRVYERLLPSSGNSGHGMRGYVVPGCARQSLLVQVLWGKKPEKARHHPEILKDEEKKAIVEWIDLGARWDDGE
jgi:hypothetical protein